MNQNPSIDNSTFFSTGSDAIARRAYDLWENEGRPEGCNLRHWLQAESELGTRRPGNDDRSNLVDTPRFNEAGGSSTSTPESRLVAGTRNSRPRASGKSASVSPFGRERNGTSNAGQGSVKRKSGSAPML